MIAGVGSIISGEGYGIVAGARKVFGADDFGMERAEPRDRWIPGVKEEEGYSFLGGAGGSGMTEAEQVQLEDLKKRDAEVRQHEQGHMAMLGGYAIGGPMFTYQAGPDGRAYAVGGSVNVDMSSTGSDAADSAKALRIRAAASGVGDMSAADMSVAAQAEKGLGFAAAA